MRDWDSVAHFSPEEFDAPERMEPAFVLRLDLARAIARVPFVLTSTWRPGRIGKGESHPRGRGADIAAATSRERWRIVEGLVRAGFHRIGLYPRHVHADDDPSLPPEVLWLGAYDDEDDEAA